MTSINSNFLKEHNYKCSLDTKNETLKITNKDKEVELVSKKSLGFFGIIENSLKSLSKNNEWTKVKVLTNNNKEETIYVKIDSIKEKLKANCDDANDLSFKSNINYWLTTKIGKNDSKRIKYDNVIKLKNDINCVNDKILKSSKNKNNAIQIDNINKDDLGNLFKYIEDNNKKWHQDLVKNKRSSMLIKHDDHGHKRTIRVDKDGGIYIILKTTIGKGSFKKARLAVDYNNNKLVANVRGIIKEDKHRLALNNDFTSPVKHKHIAKQGKILEHTNDKRSVQKMSVIMPLFNEFDMHVVKKNNPTSKQKKEIVLGSLKGLEAIHKRNLIHRDIKPANIFIKSKTDKKTGEKVYSARVGDFGFVTKQKDVAGYAGSLYYTAPEVWKERDEPGGPPPKGKSIITPASDCYSMGVTLAEFLNIELTHESECPNGLQLLDKTPPKKGTPEYLISKLLERDPKKRLTMKKAIALAKKTNF